MSTFVFVIVCCLYFYCRYIGLRDIYAQEEVMVLLFYLSLSSSPGPLAQDVLDHYRVTHLSMQMLPDPRGRPTNQVTGSTRVLFHVRV